MQTHAAKRSAVAAQLPQQTSELLTINCDNQGVIALSKDNKFHAQTKHTKICYYFIHGAVEDTKIEVKYIPMDNNVSDIFMNPLTSSALQNWSRKFKISFFLWTHSLKGNVEYIQVFLVQHDLSFLPFVDWLYNVDMDFVLSHFIFLLEAKM